MQNRSNITIAEIPMYIDFLGITYNVLEQIKTTVLPQNLKFLN